MTITASTTKNIDWLRLPDDILRSTLSKYFVTSQDYVRFSLVCKQWHSVAKAEKPNHMATRKQIPFLLVPTNEDMWSLYSVAHGRLLDSKLRVRVPYSDSICGSSHGWLIVYQGRDHDDNFIITLFNPFTQAQISLPPIPSKSSDIINKGCLQNAVLSADPSLHPHDYVLAACFHDDSRYLLALVRPGRRDGGWRTLTHSDWRPDIGRTTRCDMIFDTSGKWVYAAVGYNWMVVRAGLEDDGVLETVVEPSTDKPAGYFGESPDGDLLMFTGLYGRKVQVWKLQGSSFVKVDGLVGDTTAAFIGCNSSTMLVGRGFQGVETECVYYYDQHIRKFNLKEGEFDQRRLTNKGLPHGDSHVAIPIWIMPSVIYNLLENMWSCEFVSPWWTHKYDLIEQIRFK